MVTTGRPSAVDPTPNDDALTIPVAMLAHWAEVVAFAVDAQSERERVDALLELAEGIETILERSA